MNYTAERETSLPTGWPGLAGGAPEPDRAPVLPLSVDETDEPYWLALYSVSGIGPVRFYRLVESFGSARKAWEARRDEVMAVPGIGRHLADAIQTARRLQDAVRLRSEFAARGIRWVLYPREGYPPPLRTISTPPPILYFRSAVREGTLSDLLYPGGPAVAIVGTRSATGYGLEVAASLARDLALAGVTVVSGLALGIDTAAHEGALAGGGSTVAVLASGVDTVYPALNAPLAESLLARGALVSEVSPGKPMDAGGFPARNRIVSGLCAGVVVVEAPRKSGALITARCACEQSREVFAVPGNVDCDEAWGPNSLIKDGACLVRDVSDIMEELFGVGWAVLRQRKQDSAQAQPPAQAQPDPGLRQLLHLLAGGPLHADQLANHTGLAPSGVGVLLARAEMAGLVRRTNRGLYELARGAGEG